MLLRVNYTVSQKEIHKKSFSFTEDQENKESIKINWNIISFYI